ncbi:MAG: DUF4124 domain-containing protein [Proteobacteria bacterium]|nr:DUF4124 domain-containing protein [Burkholderiales bacterium]
MARIQSRTAALVACLWIISTGHALAQIYTWTDAQGRRQVSDRPPDASVKDFKVQGGKVPSGPVSGPGPGAAAAPVKGDEKKGQTLNEKALDFNKRQLERDESRIKQDKSDAESKERSQRCDQAQAYVRNLQAGGRATRLDTKTGERVFLDDKEREKELVDAQRSADSWCKPAASPPPGSTQVSPPK